MRRSSPTAPGKYLGKRNALMTDWEVLVVERDGERLLVRVDGDQYHVTIDKIPVWGERIWSA